MFVNSIESMTKEEQAELGWLKGGKSYDFGLELEPITEAQLVAETNWGTFHPNHMGYSQNVEINGRKTSITFFVFYDGTGVAFSHDYWTAYYETKGRETEGRAAPMQWYRFARCEHTIERTKLGNCYYRHTCTKCGFSEEVDTSD